MSRFAGPQQMPQHQIYCHLATVFLHLVTSWALTVFLLHKDKKHLKNVGPIRHCEPPHAHSPGVSTGIVARRLRIDVHDDNDNDNA